MTFRCAAAHCRSDGRKKLSKYPWMSTVRWVKWPKNPKDSSRWKRLVRRGGRDSTGYVDVFNIDKRTRLCSRHFDQESITADNTSTSDPKYFAWNNWGKPLNPRSTRRTHAMTDDNDNDGLEYDLPCTSNHLVTVESSDDHPEVGSEIITPVPSPREDYVGKLKELENTHEICQPADHDYLRTSAPTLVNSSTQTSLTSDDIEDLLKSKATTTPEKDFVEIVTDTDERVNFYTGIESSDLLHGVFNSVSEGAKNMKYWRNTSSSAEMKWEGTTRPGRKRKMSTFFEFIMTLVRLRLNLPLLLLADLFHVSTSKVSEITTTWICYLHQTLVPALLTWPSQAQVRARLPKEFSKYFPQTRAVIDCTEFYVDKPANKTEQYQTYSSYKSHNTYKCLVAVNPNGAFTFISDLWSGNVSDKFITEKSGFLDLIESGDHIMADRGFRIEELLLYREAVLIAPPFTRQWSAGKGKKKRLNVKEIHKTRMIARLRIHVERAIQRMKTWRILKHQMPSSLQNISSMTVKVIAALCNLKGPLFYGKGESHLGSHGKTMKRRMKK